MSKSVKICNLIIESSFYLLFFLIPLVMTPWSYELFEFNKILTVYFLTIIIVTTWISRMILEKKLLFPKTFWNIPLLIFLGTQFLSFIFSIDRHVSFWGYYSRFNGGLLSTITYSLLYWAFIANMNRKKTLFSLLSLGTTAIIVSTYGIAEHFGIDARYWVQDVQSRVFSTLGQPNWLAAWLIALLPLTWALIISQWPLKKSGFLNWRFWASFLLSLILLLCFLYTKSRSGFLGLTTAFILFWAIVAWLAKKEIKKLFQPFLAITILMIVFNLLISSPWQPRFFQKNSQNKTTTQEQIPAMEGGGTESGEIRKIVWKGAIDVWLHSPFLGTGPETFAFSYYWYRPVEHNAVSEWDFLYNKAHNEYLNYLATTGTIGFLGYSWLIVIYFFWSLKNLKKISWFKNFETKKKTDKKEAANLQIILSSSLQTGLLAGFVSILVTNFFGFAVVPVSILFFLFPALALSLNKNEDENSDKNQLKNKTVGKLQLFFLALSLIIALFLLWGTLRWWRADKVFALGEKLNKSGQISDAFNDLQKAIKIRPYEPIYYDELSLTSASLAVGAFQQKQATLSAQLADLAIESSSKSLIISPFNINYWKNRTRVFYTLAEINESYQQQALAALTQANKLAPTDAKILYNLALVYNKLNQKDLAIQTLEETIKLKPNYDHARYALALFYEEKKEMDKAKEQLEYIVTKISPNYEPALEKLKKIR